MKRTLLKVANEDRGPQALGAFNEACGQFAAFVKQYQGAIRDNPDARTMVEEWNRFVSVATGRASSAELTAAATRLADSIDQAISKAVEPAPIPEPREILLRPIWRRYGRAGVATAAIAGAGLTALVPWAYRHLCEYAPRLCPF